MVKGSPGFPTSASLVFRIRDPHDGKAWKEFVEIYGPFIYGLCLRYRLNEAEAADVTQNVFLQVLRSIRSFEYQPERGRFRGWLGVLTRNEIANAWNRINRVARGQGKLVTLGLPEHQVVHWEDGVWEEELAAYIHRVALERTRVHFTKRSWVIFKLTWIVGCRASRVAERLDLPIERVFEAKSRFLKRFREEVAHLAEDAVALVPLESA